MAKVKRIVPGEGLELIHGDALAVLRDLPDASVDLVIADPPYNLGKDYGPTSALLPFDDYLEFTQAWTREVRRVLKPTGTLYAFMGFRFISYLYQILEKDRRMLFNGWICWHYTQGVGRVKGFSARHDDILMFTRSASYTFNLDAVRVPQKYYRQRNNMRGANPGDVWEFSHVHYCQENRQAHPTQKPEGLIARLVRASSHPGDLVLDPFSGSGTTLRVCQQLERRCIGIEANGTYVASTEQRLAAPFEGFDSVDPRMQRVPKDLNDPVVRKQYLADHERWFLEGDKAGVKAFRKRIREMYGEDG
ncbi:MAG: site-specific DNA-methyltransferase [Bacteroidota bacterium]